MTYRELLYKATRLLDNNKITLDEYEEMTKPLDREVEQEPIFDKIRAEIEENINYNKKMNYQGIVAGLLLTLDIIDKYKEGDNALETLSAIDSIIHREDSLIGRAQEDVIRYQMICKVMQTWKEGEEK